MVDVLEYLSQLVNLLLRENFEAFLLVGYVSDENAHIWVILARREVSFVRDGIVCFLHQEHYHKVLHALRACVVQGGLPFFVLDIEVCGVLDEYLEALLLLVNYSVVAACLLVVVLLVRVLLFKLVPKGFNITRSDIAHHLVNQYAAHF